MPGPLADTVAVCRASMPGHTDRARDISDRTIAGGCVSHAMVTAGGHDPAGDGAVVVTRIAHATLPRCDLTLPDADKTLPALARRCCQMR